MNVGWAMRKLSGRKLMLLICGVEDCESLNLWEINDHLKEISLVFFEGSDGRNYETQYFGHLVVELTPWRLWCWGELRAEMTENEMARWHREISMSVSLSELSWWMKPQLVPWFGGVAESTRLSDWAEMDGTCRFEDSQSGLSQFVQSARCLWLLWPHGPWPRQASLSTLNSQSP